MDQNTEDDVVCRSISPNTEPVDEEDNEEALSLCDLPLDLIINEENDDGSVEVGESKDHDHQEFNFDSSWRSGSLSSSDHHPSEMCAADDVFFEGQILPLSRLSSVSSEGTTTGFVTRMAENDAVRCVSRTLSMDRGSSQSSLTSFNSSRSSSSSRSQYSSSSNSIANSAPRNSKPNRIINQFHACPSPKPQIRVSNSRLSKNASFNRSQRSTLWDFIKLGLVRAPEFELAPTAKRNSVSRNSSSGSSSTNSGLIIKNHSTKKMNDGEKDLRKFDSKKEKKKSTVDTRRGLMFGGCKCSISAVETVPLNMVKNGGDKINSKTDNQIDSVRGLEKKLQEMKIQKNRKKKTKKKKVMMMKKDEKQKGKQAISRYRTFEWLKELSDASYAEVDRSSSPLLESR